MAPSVTDCTGPYGLCPGACPWTRSSSRWAHLGGRAPPHLGSPRGLQWFLEKYAEKIAQLSECGIFPPTLTTSFNTKVSLKHTQISFLDHFLRDLCDFTQKVYGYFRLLSVIPKVSKLCVVNEQLIINLIKWKFLF